MVLVFLNHTTLENKIDDRNETMVEKTVEWEGWGTALKPAHEPIVLARKPISEKSIADNVLKWGTGGINIDGCRIEGNDAKRSIQIQIQILKM